jgi:hypothetical protein
MTGKHTNNTTKEQRQINQKLTKEVNEDQPRGRTDIEARTMPRQHQLKKNKPRRPGA